VASDNTVLNTGSGGETIRSLGDANGLNWPVGVSAYPTTLTPGANVVTVVDLTHGLPVQPQTGATWAVTGTVAFSNSTLAVTNAGTFVVQATQSGTWNSRTQDGSGNAIESDNSTVAGNPLIAANTRGLVTRSFAYGYHTGQAGFLPVEVDDNRALTVSGPLTNNQLRASAVPVSLISTTITGTVAATQSGTWNVTNVSGTVSLPTGAATAAKQPALGTAGTASADVLTVQGIASMTALKVDGSAVTQPVSDGGGSLTVDGSVSVSGLVPGTSATSLGKAEDAVAADGDTGVAVWAVRKDVPATTTGASGDYHPFEVDANGCLWVNGSNYTQPVSGTVAFSNSTLAVTNAGTFAVQAAQSGTWNVGTVTTVTGVTTVTTLTTCSTVTNLAQLGGAAIAMNTGVRAAGVQRVTICTDDVVPASQSGTWTVQPGNTANTTAWLVNDNPVTSGGLSISSFLSTAAVQATAVKASAGQVYSIEFFNVGAAAVYVRLYNMTTTPGTGDTVVWRGIVPGNTAGAGFVKTWDKGLAFSTGIGFRCTAAIADNDNTALSANAVMGNICYK